MTQLEEIDHALRGLLTDLRGHQEYDTGHDDTWQRGWHACDLRRIVQIENILKRVQRLRQAGG